jgi:threonine aldolase
MKPDQELSMIDLRSDTVTLPTPEMREVIASAEVGDDVYGEDPSVNCLEEESANLLGKQAALFIPSGTMGNLAAILTHCGRGSEIILGDKAHIFVNEAGGAAALGGIQPHIIPNQKDGTLKLGDIEEAIRVEDIHHPRTKLIALENTHNLCGGVALTVDYTRSVGEIAREQDLKFHLDGARLFNAATALEEDPADLVEPFDSVMFCLSKGLGAPVGSVLCGDNEFIARARRTRKMLGGSMRQAGLIAKAGLYALQHHLPLIAEDHRRAQELAEGLADLPGVCLMDRDPPTNMVYLRLDPALQFSAEDIKDKLKAVGILIGYENLRLIRLVTHLGIKDDDLPLVVQGFQEALSS